MAHNSTRCYKIVTIILLFLAVGASGSGFSQGFLKAAGKKIVDGNGNAVMLRGMGLGGWMLQEGYMLETGDFAGTQHEIRARITSLVGPAGAQKFYDAWLTNHVTRADIDTMANWGFNSVRPALHYNLFTLPIEQEPVAGSQTWIEKGFVMLDSLIAWCAANRMYVILDLHAAPGGQGRDNNISDRDPGKPSLWESEANRIKTIELWKRLAERYGGNPWVGGYDLLNETNWDFENSGNANGCACQQNAPLLDLFRKIITGIRQSDPNHLIFIEGNCWSGNFNGLSSLATFDGNLAFSFHRYWNRNDLGTIQEKLNFRNQYNIPLWMGESGENSNHWFADAVTLLETNDIGWCWWPEKKINSVVGPLTVIKTPEYEQLLRYWRNGGAKPDSAFAMNALLRIADNLKIANCIIHPDVPDALFRQQLTNETKPFAVNRVPGTIQAVDFDMGRNGFAYSDSDYQNTDGLGSSEWNRGYVYRNDGPDIEACSDSTRYNKGYNLNYIEKGEWLAYTLTADSSGVYNISLRTASASGMGAFRIEIDGKNVTGSVAVPHTGGTQRFVPINLKDIELKAGTRKMILYIEEGGFNINSIAFNGPTGAEHIQFRLLSAKTDDQGKQIILTFNRPLSGGQTAAQHFSLAAGNRILVPDSVTYQPESDAALSLWFSSLLSDTELMKLSWNGSDIRSIGQEPLAPFTDVPVVNTIVARTTIPGTLEAENATVNRGFSFELTSDAGGGKNAGWTEAGDYLEFQVRIAEKALYRITYRYSCNNASASAALSLTGGTPKNIHTVTFNGTGGWQEWNSVTLSDTLPAGPETIRFTALTNGFNLNRIDFVKVPNKDTIPTVAEGFKIYPNPADDFVVVEISNPRKRLQQLELTDLLGRTIWRQETPSATKSKFTLNTTGYLPGIYLVRLGDDQSRETQTFMIRNRNL